MATQYSPVANARAKQKFRHAEVHPLRARLGKINVFVIESRKEGLKTQGPPSMMSEGFVY